jgi:ketosteroid isomerase-like protein
MATQHTIDEADIRQRVGQCAEAIRARDIEGVMSLYAPHIVSFDLDPPLQYTGVEAKRKRWLNVFAMYQRVLDYEVRSLTITLGDDIAFGHSLNRISGILKSGSQAGFWLRWTTCFQKIDGNWLIAHEQLSVPIDPESGRALLHLEP